MFCSTIIPTIGRPSLSRAVCSVLDQEFSHDDFEVIVVSDSRKPLPILSVSVDARSHAISVSSLLIYFERLLSTRKSC